MNCRSPATARSPRRSSRRPWKRAAAWYRRERADRLHSPGAASRQTSAGSRGHGDGGAAAACYDLAAGRPKLHAALVTAYGQLGVQAGSFELLGGLLATAAYHVTGPQTDSPRVAEYGPPTIMPGAATLIHASGSYGLDLAGMPMVHIHGAFADAAGRTYGGHVNQELSIIGPGGVRAILVLGPGFRQIADRETLFPLFFPFAEAAPHGALYHPADHDRPHRDGAAGAQ